MNCATIVEIVAQLIALSSIILTTFFAIRAINETSRKNRIEKAYDEMLKVIIEQFQLLQRTIHLLWKTSQRAHIFKLPEHKEIDTGYNRFWNQTQDIAEKTDALHSRRNLFLPPELQKELNKAISAINKGSKLAIDATPSGGKNHEELEAIVNEAAKAYNTALNCARKYIGIDKLDKISLEDTVYLTGKEEEFMEEEQRRVVKRYAGPK